MIGKAYKHQWQQQINLYFNLLEVNNIFIWIGKSSLIIVCNLTEHNQSFFKSQYILHTIMSDEDK